MHRSHRIDALDSNRRHHVTTSDSRFILFIIIRASHPLHFPTPPFMRPPGHSSSSLAIARRIRRALTDALFAPFRAYTASSSKPTETFVLPPVRVAYDVDDAERALRDAGFDERPGDGDEPSLVGFDVETRPNFTGKTGKNPPALVQVANARAAVLVHLASMRPSVPPTLRAMCADARTLFVGTGVAVDMKDVETWLGVKCDGFVDTGVVARTYGHKRFGLKATSAYYGYAADKPKSTQTSNWEKAPLDEKQITYGAEDAALGLWVLKAMYAEHGGGADGCGLNAWAEAFAGATSPEEAWRKNKDNMPEVVIKAFKKFREVEKAESREVWVTKKHKKALGVIERVWAGASHPVQAAHALADLLRSPKSGKRAVAWSPGGKTEPKSPEADGMFRVRLKFGSRGMESNGQGLSFKAAKLEAAKNAFDAIRASGDSSTWLKDELELVFDK